MSSDAFRAALASYAPEFDLSLSSETLDRFCSHYDLLLQWNRKVNLTRITEPAEAARRHFLESAFLSRVLDPRDRRIVDVGSGAGFPGVPVACMFPAARMTLVEPLGKRAVFLKEVVRRLDLTCVEVRNAPFSTGLVDSTSVLVARALDGFRELLPGLVGSSAETVVLYSEPGLLETARRLGPDRTARVVELPGSDRRQIGLFERQFHVERP